MEVVLLKLFFVKHELGYEKNSREVRRRRKNRGVKQRTEGPIEIFRLAV